MSSQISRVQKGTNQALARLQFGPGCIRTLIREHAHAQHHFNCHSCTLRLGSLAKLGPQPQLGLRAFRRIGSFAGGCRCAAADGKNIIRKLNLLAMTELLNANGTISGSCGLCSYHAPHFIKGYPALCLGDRFAVVSAALRVTGPNFIRRGPGCLHVNHRIAAGDDAHHRHLQNMMLWNWAWLLEIVSERRG